MAATWSESSRSSRVVRRGIERRMVLTHSHALFQVRASWWPYCSPKAQPFAWTRLEAWSLLTCSESKPPVYNRWYVTFSLKMCSRRQRMLPNLFRRYVTFALANGGEAPFEHGQLGKQIFRTMRTPPCSYVLSVLARHNRLCVSWHEVKRHHLDGAALDDHAGASCRKDHPFLLFAPSRGLHSRLVTCQGCCGGCRFFRRRR